VIVEGRIPMNDAEEAAVNTILYISGITRRDPGDTGPIIVETLKDEVFQVDSDGTITDVTVPIG
jgi:hypothetical protein